MERKAVWCAILLGILLVSRMVGADEDCVEGEDDCQAPTVTQTTDAQNSIYILTDENFAEIVKEEEMIMATFYAPWCHHCHNAITVFEEAVKQLSSYGISIGKLDIEANKETKTKYQIKQVPDVRIFRKGRMYPYEGPGDNDGVQAIVDFMIKERLKDEDGAVLTLTQDNFDNILESTPLILVEFYAEWCEPCQALEPHFYAAARRLRTNSPPVILGQVRVPDQLELAKRFPLTGYPVLLMFRYGKEYNYTGPVPREEDGIVKYMQHQAGPSSIPLNSEPEVATFISSDSETRVIGFLDNSKQLDAFVEAGNKVRVEMDLGHCTSKQIAESMGFRMGVIVVFYPKNLVSKYEDGRSVISPVPSESKDIALLLLEHGRPLVGEMTKENELTLYHQRPLLVAYYDVDWHRQLKKATGYWHGILASVAKDFTSENLTFAIANEQSFPTDIKVLGLDDWGEDVTVGIFAPLNVRYPMKEELYPESLREFVEGFLSGDLEPFLRSEPVPKKSKSVVKTVVGTTFQKFLTTSNKAALLKLCMPEANGCSDADKHFEQVVIRYEGSSELTFGEMNVALNDVPIGVDISDLPAYLFARKDSGGEHIRVSPNPTDENDILFFLKYKEAIRPTVGDRELHRREEKKEREKKKRKQNKKKAKDEL